MNTFRVLTYKGSGNLGDMVQTYALTRLLPSVVGTLRDGGTPQRGNGIPFVVNGFVWKPLVHHGGPFLIAGAHLSRDPRGYPEWLRRSAWTIGVRDPWTLERVNNYCKISNAKMVGCATLTFERYTGPRNEEYSVDVKGPGKFITHCTPPEMSVQEQWARCRDVLYKYQTAKLVHTCRLHVILPCLAFGTPVCFVPKPLHEQTIIHPERLSLLDYLGIKPGVVTTKDVSPIATVYKDFLSECLGIPIKPGHPKFPNGEDA